MGFYLLYCYDPDSEYHPEPRHTDSSDDSVEDLVAIAEKEMGDWDWWIENDCGTRIIPSASS